MASVRRKIKHQLEKEVIQALRSNGCSVIQLELGDRIPDLLVGYRGVNLLLRISPTLRSTRPARDFDSSWSGAVIPVNSAKNALAILEILAQLHQAYGQEN